MIGINAAISSRASSIGFAVPINGATAILPQLRAHGRVARGYIGVALRDIDADLQRSLKLTVAHGAVVQDVTTGSPGDRAGVQPYDVIVALDDRQVANDDELIRDISARAPGSAAHVTLIRDGRERVLTLKLAERPARDPSDRPVSPTPVDRKMDGEGLLGLSVRELDRATAQRLDVPKGISGVLITRVEPMSASFDAGIDRGAVLLEINRQAIASVADYKRLARAARPGDVFTLYVYAPDLDQRKLLTVRVDDR